MKYLAYQEKVNDTTYSLYVREVKDYYIYDLEVKTLINKKHRIKTARNISTDCQKSFLLLEMLIQNRISIDSLIKYENQSKKDVPICC